MTAEQDSYLVEGVQFRDHPFMAYKNGSNWPPIWTTPRKDETDTPRGEVGTLLTVLMNDLTDNIIFMRIDYQGKPYMGCLVFKDPSFCRHINVVLHGLIGRSIKEIGDLDLSYTL